MSQSIIYSLKTVNNRTVIDYSIGLKIVCETTKELQIELPTGIVTLNKFQYVNKNKIYDTGNKLFFMVANKRRDIKDVQAFLMTYAIRKVTDRLQLLTQYKNQLQAEKLALKPKRSFRGVMKPSLAA